MSLGEAVHAAWLRLRALRHRRRLERDLDDELRFHLDLRAQEYAAAGLSAADARDAALRRFGNAFALKERCRDMWSFVRLETLGQDVRVALRTLRTSRGFAAVAVLSLALGIGANAAMFSLLSAVVLRPLPYPEADRLVRLTGSYPKGAVAAMQEQSRTLDVAGAGTDQEWNLTGDGEPARVVGSAVSANLFAVLGRGATHGRVFADGDEQPGHDRIAILGHELWRQRYGGDPEVVGRAIVVDGVTRQVVGVMPSGFHFPSADTQVWVPLRLDPRAADDYWGFGWMPVVARLKPGATLAQAQGELRPLIGRVAGLFPWPAPNWNADAAALPLQADLVRDVRRKLVVLQAAVALVLLIACANVASLLLSRAAARRREMALRAALGAGRARLVRQLLTESLVLSVAGGVLGVGLAAAVLSGLVALLPGGARGFSEVAIDGGVLAFTSGLAVACGLVFGIVPALAASRVDLAGAIKAGGQRATGRGGVRLRGAFIAAEVALAVVLAVGAGLLMRTLWRLTQADPGFRSQQVLAVRVSPDPGACAVRASCVALYDDLLHRVQEEGGLGDVAAASALPLDGEQPLLPVEVEGHPMSATDKVPPLLWSGAVTPAYFRVMGIPLVRGRGVEAADGETSAPVVVVSAATARRYWPEQDPIGKRIRVMWEPGWRTVVGVAGDVRQYALSGRTPPLITGALYMPYPQAVALNRQVPRAMSLVVRSGQAGAVAPRLRALVAGLRPDMPTGDVRALDAVVASSVAEPRALMWLFAGFAGCALLLAAIGTYGVVSFATAQRTYEIGVRVAVGASRADVFGLVMGQSLRLTLVGLAGGVAAALVLGRALSSFLYGVSAADPLTFGGVVGLLLLTALVAGYLPGRRAAGTDPVRALRTE